MFSCQSRRHEEDRCWIMLGKWSTSSFTCLVLNEHRGNEGWKGLEQERQMLKEAKRWSTFNWAAKLSRCLLTTGAHYNPTISKVIDSSCSTAALHLITSWMTSLWAIQEMQLLSSHLVFLPSPLAIIPPWAELFWLPRAESSDASLRSAADEGPTGNHQ